MLIPDRSRATGVRWALTAVLAATLAGWAATGHVASARVASAHGVSTHVAARARPAGADQSTVYEWGQFGGGLHHFAARRAGGGRLSGSPFGIGPVRDTPRVVPGLRGTIVQIATSNSDSYALTRDGRVYAWGPGAQGELGDGTRTRLSETAVQVRFPAGTRIVALPNPMPYDGGMAIAAGGTVWAWGNDRARDFCQPQGSIITTPVPVPLSHVTLAAGALRHTLYDAGGRIVGCGAGPLGQLGNGTRGPQARAGTPVAVRGLPYGRAVALTAGWGDAGVLMASGTYYDWGYNADGQLGDGSTSLATIAVPVDLPGHVTRVFAGGSYANNGQTMAILADGAFWEWGAGGLGQLGDDRTTNARWPLRLTPPDGSRFVAVSSGGSTDYAVDGQDQLWEWGNNRVGQLGTRPSMRMALTPILGPVDVTQVSSTAHNVAALAVSDGGFAQG